MAGPTSTIALKLPSKYSSATSDSAAPTIDWLSRSWTVTHSTLSMWRAARNVRITYKPLPPKADGRLRIDDLVEYEPSDKDTALKSVAGIDTQSPGGWDWRGKGWLFFVGSHWELLGWGGGGVGGRQDGEVGGDMREGLSEATYGKIDQALRGLDAKALVDMVAQDMRPVEIKLPWAQK
ncbi:hypothetical protein TrVGV298_005232 [Trichoderma virens]|nr:hypothetical protein TrVGV298_005232 [Trichoderma virens]